MNIETKINEIIGNKDNYIFAIANIKGLLGEKYSGFNYAISIARKLEDEIIDEISNGPTLEYLQNYKNVNAELLELIVNISNMLTNENIRNLPIKPTYEDDEPDENYFKTLRTDFSHKMVATRAGIGWIGKTDLLVTLKFGPRVRLASILVDDDFLKPGIPIEKSRCGTCDICVKSCPAQAANGTLWNTNTDRNEFYDAFKCREKCLELSKRNLNETISLCGICVSMCPIGKEIKGTIP
jgi:epoxyqueuosine reductase QueG